MPDAKYAGLFGRCITSTIINIRLVDPSVRREDSVGWKHVEEWSH